jgi:hypothetical protein
MQDLIGLGQLIDMARQAVSDFEAKRQAIQAQPWKELLNCLDMLQKLTRTHVEAINRVVTPIINEGDILTTCQYYRELVNAPEFPIGYDYVHGVIGGLRDQKQFQEREIHGWLKTITDELGKFQYTVFVLKYHGASWGMANAFETARDLWSRLPSGNEPQPDPQIDKLRRDVQDFFRQAFESVVSKDLKEEDKKEITFPLITSDDVVALLREWCLQWQRCVQVALYGGHGLNYAIGRVRILAPRIQ